MEAKTIRERIDAYTKEKYGMMEEKTVIQPCSMEHLDEYGRIYVAAFSGSRGTIHGSRRTLLFT